MMAHCKNSALGLFILTYIIVFVADGYSQDTLKSKPSANVDKADIKWISQWPSAVQKSSDKNKRSLKDIIIGKAKLKLNKPVSMVVNGKGNYWVLDQKNNAVFQVVNNEYEMPHFIEKKRFNLTSLVGICNFKDGKMLFTDSYLNKIFLIDPEKKSCTVLNDSLKLDKPTGIAYSPLNHEIWITETGAHRVVVLNEKGDMVKKIGSRGNAKGEFNFPTHICIDKKGNAYIVDAMNFRVQVLNKDKEVISVFGSSGDVTGSFSSPKGIAVDSYGDIYVADALFNVVQIFDINGNFLYTFGSQGQEEGQFWMPAGIFIDENDRIYVADSYNSRIQIFQLITENKK